MPMAPPQGPHVGGSVPIYTLQAHSHLWLCLYGGLTLSCGLSKQDPLDLSLRFPHRGSQRASCINASFPSLVQRLKARSTSVLSSLSEDRRWST